MQSFSLLGNKWGNPINGTPAGQVTWSFALFNTVGGYSFDRVITEANFQQLIRDAFDTWEAVANIDFVEVTHTSASMIRLGWDAIDGAFGTVGEASNQTSSSDGVNFSIVDSEVRFDTAEIWSDDKTHTGNLINFFGVAVHEIGHSIGLGHVDDINQIMAPIIGNQVVLGVGDILGAQTLYGAAAVTAANATQGNDIFNLTTGDDTIDGLGGVDTVIFSVVRSAITTTKFGVTITATGQGTDTLTNIERLKFSDGILAFDVDGNAGQAYRVYQAAFARTPDNDGLKFWIGEMDKDLSLNNVAAGFVASNEFMSVYGSNPTNTSIVEKMYQNVLGRDGEASGVAFWVGELTSGNRDTANVLAGFSESPENVARVGSAINDGIWYI